MLRVTMLLMGLVVLAAAGQSQALTVVDFHTDAVIQEGDAYDVVNVWDNARIVMTGGMVREVRLHDGSSLDVSGGDIGEYLFVGDASYLRMSGPAESSLIIAFAGTSVSDMYGWVKGANLSATGESRVNVYGYGFQVSTNYGAVLLHGIWENDEAFSMYLRGGERDYARFVLHEIPEPGVLGLLAVGWVVSRWRRNAVHASGRSH
ncbi:MAG TPA: hypothetical protein ENN81_01565 [Phycisphaerales bacterium]|nr:hypothetical protein [Phycisphaerales bacterium]